VLVVHPGADLYGSDRMLLESVTGLVQDGRRVVVALPGPGPLVARLEDQGAEVRFVPMPVLRKSALSPRGLAVLVGRTVHHVRPAVSLLRELRPDTVYVSTLTLPSWLLLARLLGRPTVCHVHEADQHRSAIVSRALVVPLLLADALIANSAYTRSVLTAAAPRLDGRITVVHNGVTPPAGWSPARAILDGPVRMLFVGRLSPRKGPDVAAAAVRLLAARGTAVRLDVVGDVFPGYEWYEEQLTREFADLVASGRLRLHGFAADVWPHIARSDVVVVPAVLPESLGNTAIEAVLGARPAVVSALGGLTEVAEMFPTVRSVEAGDAEALAHAVTTLVEDWSSVTSAAEAQAPLAARRFAPEEYRRRVVSVVERLARGQVKRTLRREISPSMADRPTWM
jgi:glycosyltransferase involved in cell wall biosynthesis